MTGVDPAEGGDDEGPTGGSAELSTAVEGCGAGVVDGAGVGVGAGVGAALAGAAGA